MRHARRLKNRGSEKSGGNQERFEARRGSAPDTVKVSLGREHSADQSLNGPVPRIGARKAANVDGSVYVEMLFPQRQPVR